jgi:hypothetical protein
MTQALPTATQQLAQETQAFPPADLWSDEPPLESDLHRDLGLSRSPGCVCCW